MTDPTRPVPRWLRGWAVFTLVTAVVLLAVGGFVTSFRAGMADPVWPTEPWYLAENFRLDPGYLVEHAHRIVAFAVGGCAVVLAAGAWLAEPRKGLRYAGLAAVVLLCLAFGAFHGAMMQSWKEAKAVTPMAKATGAASLAGAVALLGLGWAAAGTPGGRVRAWAGVALVAVMVQGLLGGLRVFLNELVGTDLAAVHGVFAQVTFCVLVAVVLLASPRNDGDTLPPADRGPVRTLAVWLTALLFVQLVWAVMVRHQGWVIAQRLHMLTAFAVTGLAVWAAFAVYTRPAARPRLKGAANHLLALLALQLILGVEAYMGKFAAAGPEAQVPPTLRTVTPPQAGIRTAHQLVGTGLLAAAVGLAVRAGRRPVLTPTPAPDSDETVVLGPRPSPSPAAVP